MHWAGRTKEKGSPATTPAVGCGLFQKQTRLHHIFWVMALENMRLELADSLGNDT